MSKTNPHEGVFNDVDEKMSEEMGAMGLAIAEQRQGLEIDPKDAKGGSPVGLGDTTPTVGPPRVPEKWETYNREEHGRVPSVTIAFEGLREQMPVGKMLVMKTVDRHLAQAGVVIDGKRELAKVYCVTPPTMGSMADVEGKEDFFEVFVQVAIRKADDSWVEWGTRTILLKPTKRLIDNQ